MPALSRWFIRVALVYLALGFGLGGLLLAGKGLGLDGRLFRLLPLHVEWLFLGWTVQLAFGVGFWIVPRVDGARRRAWLAWLSFALLNGGLALSTALRLAAAVRGRPAAGSLFPLASLLVAGGALAFAAHLWPRVRPFLEPGVPRREG